MIEIQGHRGCRGIYPENTIEGFKHATDLGVDVLEMDVVISKDHQVIVSHEPFFNHEISTGPDGQFIPKDQELAHNLYQMTYEEIKTYDVGKKPHPRFLIQKKMPAVKPLLKNMFVAIERHTQQRFNPIKYNIEIKRKKGQDGIYHPPVEQFVQLVCDEIIASGCADRVSVQCFDHEGLRFVHQLYPTLQTVMLVEDKRPPQDHLDILGFVPTIYSPSSELVDSSLVDYCRAHNMQLIPWTVNEPEEAIRVAALGIDGIITDYPERIGTVIRDWEGANGR